MAVKTGHMHSYDWSDGEIHDPRNPMRPLVYNIANMTVGRIELGSREWWLKMCDALHHLDYPDLEPVFRGKRLPRFVSDRLESGYKAWVNSAKQHPHRNRCGTPPKHSKRVNELIEVLQQAPLDRLGFITAVECIEGTEQEAIQAAEDGARRLGSYIRRRFDHPVCLMFPEVDEKVLKDVDAALILKAKWKLEFDENQRVFKVHYHGVIYVPEHYPEDIEQAFRLCKNGKRNRRYSGANQVRVIAVEEAPGYDDETADIDGCCGYATKYHYKPPVKARMLEGFVNWLIVTDAIIRNPKTIVTVGVRYGIQTLCKRCETYHEIGSECSCSVSTDPVYTHDSFEEESVDKALEEAFDRQETELSHSSEHPYDHTDMGPKVGIILNSESASIWNSAAKAVSKKLTRLVASLTAPALTLLRFFRKPQGP
ncbi:MAG: hypothetical protein AAGK92_13590 [Pseudomonadota bacterium]